MRYLGSPDWLFPYLKIQVVTHLIIDQAIAGAAALFALIHVPIYGFGVLPIDFAAGLLLGWQRRESGTWTSSAVTHVIASQELAH